MKKYFKPELSAIELNTNCNILAGSLGQSNTEATVEGGSYKNSLGRELDFDDEE
ncbi:MAG: hypothetical protein IJ155_07335 [Prevotella sp.]|nr:hypothetical protein [Prevotella sp.]